MIMKKAIVFGLTLLAIVGTVQASLYYQGDLGGISTSGGTAVGSVANSGTIADGNPLGLTTSMNLSGFGLGNALQTITLSLNVSGGNNSDLYAYLSCNGQMVVVLNRIGVSGSTPFGNTGSGLNVTLDSTSGNIHNTAVGLTAGGIYAADGQNISPLSSAASFNANGNGSITLNGTFANVDPNGTWTLFFADTVTGGGSETLQGWSLDLTAVPEPVNVALGIFGVVLAGTGFVRRYGRPGKSPSI